MNSVFRAGGAISTEDISIYIIRRSDEEIKKHLERMRYMLVIEPRQQGKTSLINSLMRTQTREYVFAYLDMTTIDQSSEISFYTSLFERLRSQFKFVNHGMATAIDGGISWREFLFKVASYAADKNKKIIIVLDEIGAVHFPKSTDFFSILRDLFNSRQVQPDLNNLTFILVGAFHPRELIEDKNVSPFNIAERVRLPDFNLEQVLELVKKGSWHPTKFESLAKQIFYWTDGQPYLTQYLCSRISESGTTSEVDNLIEIMRREDENHLPPILHRLENSPELYDYLKGILKGRSVKFFPGENKLQAQLELLGLIKPDQKGFCKIRNRVYETSLKSFYANGHQQVNSKQSSVDSKPSKNKLVILIFVASTILSLAVGLLSNLAATYLAPNMADNPWVVYGGLLITFVLGLLISIYLYMKEKE